MSSETDEFAHLVKQMASAQMQDIRSFIYGHISNYDPSLHRVRVMFPTLRDENGNPALSPWMPLNSCWTGNAFGFQAAPLGGATNENPTAGEQVMVNLVERGRGISLAANLVFNNSQLPPNTTLAPGEAIAKHMAGSYLYFQQTGDVTLLTNRDLIANAGRDAIITTTRDMTATIGRNLTAEAQGNVDINGAENVSITAGESITFDAPLVTGSDGQTLHQLVTDVLVGLFNSHTHPAEGGDTGIPNQQMGDAELTTTFKAA